MINDRLHIINELIATGGTIGDIAKKRANYSAAEVALVVEIRKAKPKRKKRKI